MEFRKQITAFTLGIGLSLTCLASEFREQISVLERQYEKDEGVIQSQRNILAEKTQDIEKVKVERSAGIVSKLVLQKKMREAQTISKDLEELVKKQAQLALRLRRLRSELLHEIDVELQTMTEGRSRRKLADLRRFQSLVAEKDQILSIQQKTLLEVPDFNLTSPSNEREDLEARLRVIEDLQKNIQQKIAFLRAEISEERSKQFLRNEVAHFIDEENFFGEQTFISSGLDRRDNNAKNLSGLALKRDVAGSPTGPATQPLPPAPSTSAAETTSSSAPASSLSTSFQQPQEMAAFEALLEQVQKSIQDIDPKNGKTVVVDRKIPAKDRKSYLEQNLNLSEEILSELTVLRENYDRKIQTLH